MDLLAPTLGNSWKRFRRRHLRPWRTVTYQGIRVHYKKHLDGGGSGIGPHAYGQDYIPFLRSLGMPKQSRVFEWCAGPGFIGFSILAHGLCETLCLADINDEAVEACQRTIRDNRLEGRATVYESDNLSNVPREEQWDLVVGNPPFYPDKHEQEIRAHDKDWHIHRESFATVGKFLKPGGVVLLQEANDGSTVDTFHPMIESAGFSLVLTHGMNPGVRRVYYIGLVRAFEPAPEWLT
jgi:methylase of polypeptide subunit release factors